MFTAIKWFSHLIYTSANNSGNLPQILLSRYFREELKQNLWGKASPGKTVD